MFKEYVVPTTMGMVLVMSLSYAAFYEELFLRTAKAHDLRIQPYEKVDVEITIKKRVPKDEFIADAMKRIIHAESGGNKNAKNRLSSATGLGQFIDETWLRLYRQVYPQKAKAMSRAAILNLRTDVTVSKRVLREFINQNIDKLKENKVPISYNSVYLAHFAGPNIVHKIVYERGGKPLSEIFGSGTLNANPFLKGKDVLWIVDWADKKMKVKYD